MKAAPEQQHEGQERPAQTPQELIVQMQKKRTHALIQLLRVLGVLPKDPDAENKRKN